MGIMNGLMGNASEIKVSDIQVEFAKFLVEGEAIVAAYKFIRDKMVFTSLRLIIQDIQGITGTKVSYRTIPYRSIIQFSIESAGVLDLDAELKIWIAGMPMPMTKKFSKHLNLDNIHNVISSCVLRK